MKKGSDSDAVSAIETKQLDIERKAQPEPEAIETINQTEKETAPDNGQVSENREEIVETTKTDIDKKNE